MRDNTPVENEQLITNFANQFSRVDFEVSQLEKYQAAALMQALANIARVAAQRDEEINSVFNSIVIPQARDVE